MAAKKKSEFLMYKDKPLVRKGNTIYYGSLGDEFVLMLQILSTKSVDGIEMADRVSVQLINTDPTSDRMTELPTRPRKWVFMQLLTLAEFGLKGPLHKL